MDFIDDQEEHDMVKYFLEHFDSCYCWFEPQVADILKIDRKTLTELIEQRTGRLWDYKITEISGRKRKIFQNSSVPLSDYYFNPKQAAEVLGCHVTSIYRRIELGDLPALYFIYQKMDNKAKYLDISGDTWIYKEYVYAFDKLLGEKKRNGRRRFPRFTIRKNKGDPHA